MLNHFYTRHLCIYKRRNDLQVLSLYLINTAELERNLIIEYVCDLLSIVLDKYSRKWNQLFTLPSHVICTVKHLNFPPIHSR